MPLFVNLICKHVYLKLNNYFEYRSYRDDAMINIERVPLSISPDIY